MFKFGIISLLVVTAITFVSADASMAKMRAPLMHKVLLKDLKARLQVIQKNRALNGQESSFRDLVTFGEVIKVEEVISQYTAPEVLDSAALMSAIKRKISEDPKWNLNLDAAGFAALKPSLESFKTSFGEKSYVWAWMLKQNGDNAGAKKILTDLYRQNSDLLMQQSMINHGHNPLMELESIQQALIPMSTDSEKKQMDEKMQLMKKHVSNLPDAMMMT